MKVELSSCEIQYLIKTITCNINDDESHSWVLAADLRDRLFSYIEAKT